MLMTLWAETRQQGLSCRSSVLVFRETSSISIRWQRTFVMITYDVLDGLTPRVCIEINDGPLANASNVISFPVLQTRQKWLTNKLNSVLLCLQIRSATNTHLQIIFATYICLQIRFDHLQSSFCFLACVSTDPLVTLIISKRKLLDISPF